MPCVQALASRLGGTSPSKWYGISDDTSSVVVDAVEKQERVLKTITGCRCTTSALENDLTAIFGVCNVNAGIIRAVH